MCVDRRGFMQIAAGAASIALLPGRQAVAEEAPLPDAVKNLKNRLEGVSPITDDERKGRIAKAQRLMKENGLGATYAESGSSLFYYTGVRWGRSERMFAMVIPAEGDPAWVCPAFEEERAKELIRFGNDIRTWEEHESPYKLVAQILADRGVRTGKMGIEESTRCRKRTNGPSFSGSSPAWLAISARSSRRRPYVFHDSPSAPPGLSCRVQIGTASASRSAAERSRPPRPLLAPPRVVPGSRR